MKTLLLALSAVSLSVHGQDKPLIPVQVVPAGIESVNGSDVNMGCTSPLVDRGGVMVCESMSHLVDGCSPDIDTNTSDWASQIVTVGKSFTDDVPFQHVLLTFGFDTAVSLTGIELDLFLCPEWKIGAPYITVYADEEDNLVFTNPLQSSLTFIIYEPTQSSCNSLSSVSIPFLGGPLASLSFRTWHILVSRSIDWVHVGEVRFSGTAVICSTIVLPYPDCHTDKRVSTSAILLPTPTTPLITTPDNRQVECPYVCGEKETCPEEISSSVVIAVSAVSLLLIVTLTTVILTQCLLMIRMRRSIHRNETYTEVMTSTTMHKDVPVSPNEAYAVTKMSSASAEVTYELVK